MNVKCRKAAGNTNKVYNKRNVYCSSLTHIKLLY